MNDVAMRHSGAPVRAAAGSRRNDEDWAPGPEQILIGKDVLELLSTSMYVDPMTVYRECPKRRRCD